MHPVNQPEVMIGNASKRFDEQGNLTDKDTERLIGELLNNLATWTRTLKAKG